MAQITPLVEVDFSPKEFLDIDLVIGLLVADAEHVDYPNRVKVHQQRALGGGHIALSAFEAEEPWVVLVGESEIQGSSLPGPRYPAGPGIHATLYLSGIDPEVIKVASVFQVTKRVGIFDRPLAPFTRIPDEVVRTVGYTHMFDVAAPFLGRMTVFATKDKIVPRRELKY